jgi:hypothetical protein
MLSGRQSRPSCAIASGMASVTNMNDVLEGHVALDLGCIDRLYLNAYVPILQAGGQVERFCRHLGQPIASPAVVQKIGNRFRRDVDAFAGQHKVPILHLKKPDRSRWDDRKLDHVRPHLDKAERAGRCGVVAIVQAQEFQYVFSATKKPGRRDRHALGVSMTANDIYTVAGSSSGSAGSNGDGGAASAALLKAPQAIALDSAGDLLIADSSNNRVQEVAAATGTRWGISMTAGDIYTISGSSSGSSGSSGDGGAASSALFSKPAGVALDSSGDLIVSDESNDVVREVPVATTSTPAQTPGDLYGVAGSFGGCATSGDGRAGRPRRRAVLARGGARRPKR